MLGIVLALGSALSWGLSDYLGGVEARRASLIWVMFVSETAGTTALIVVLLVRGVGLSSLSAMLPAAAAGLAGVAGMAMYYRGLATGVMSIVAPIASMGVTVPVVVGIVSGDRPAVVQVVGIVAAVIGVVLATREPTTRPGAIAGPTGAGLAVAAAFGFGVWLIGMDASAQTDPFYAALASRLPPTVLLAMLALRGRGQARHRAAARAARHPSTGRRASILILVGVLDVSANCFYTSASRHGLLSVVSVLACLNPLVTVALARTLLGERVARVQELGVLAALSGVLLIAVG